MAALLACFHLEITIYLMNSLSDCKVEHDIHEKGPGAELILHAQTVLGCDAGYIGHVLQGKSGATQWTEAVLDGNAFSAITPDLGASWLRRKRNAGQPERDRDDDDMRIDPSYACSLYEDHDRHPEDHHDGKQWNQPGERYRADQGEDQANDR